MKESFNLYDKYCYQKTQLNSIEFVGSKMRNPFFEIGNNIISNNVTS